MIDKWQTYLGLNPLYLLKQHQMVCTLISIQFIRFHYYSIENRDGKHMLNVEFEINIGQAASIKLSIIITIIIESIVGCIIDRAYRARHNNFVRISLNIIERVMMTNVQYPMLDVLVHYNLQLFYQSY